MSGVTHKFPSVADDQDLKAAIDRRSFQRADRARLGEIKAVDVGNEIDLASGGVHGQSARTLTRREILNYFVGVSVSAWRMMVRLP